MLHFNIIGRAHTVWLDEKINFRARNSKVRRECVMTNNCQYARRAKRICGVENRRRTRGHTKVGEGSEHVHVCGKQREKRINAFQMAFLI